MYNWFAKPNDASERTLDVNGQGDWNLTDSNFGTAGGLLPSLPIHSFDKHNFKLL